MIVHNLTDYGLPYRDPRKPRKLKVAGVEIEPGKLADIPDHRLQPSDIAGWITANEVSIDGLPEWYQEARRQKMDRKSAPAVEGILKGGKDNKKEGVST
jgi:hypothetical protein